MKLFAIVCLATVVVLASGQSIEDCLSQDSISCIQRSFYRKAKEFFGKDSFEIVSGVSLVKSKNGRSSKSGKEILYDQEINSANNVIERQSVLENFVGEETSDFFSGRSLKINFVPAIEKIGQTARALADSVPQEIRQAADKFVEGRGKKKQMIKQIMPLLLLAKVKLGLLAVLAYFAIALIAKKAIISSLIAIAIAGFLKIKSMLQKSGGGGFGGVTSYNSGSSGWAGPAASSAGWQSSSSGWDAGASQGFSGYHR